MRDAKYPRSALDGRPRFKPGDRKSANGKVLIVGGYGQVGRAIAERLAPHFPGRVIVSGRDGDKAREAAANIGYGTLGHAVDITTRSNDGILDDVALALVCLDQADTGFVEQCLGQGIDYLDISADNGFLVKVERLDAVAKTAGATAVLSIGVAPGLTNLLAAHACALMDGVDRVDLVLEFGLGDRHGRAAVEWMFKNFNVPYDVLEKGVSKPVRSFGDARTFYQSHSGKKRKAHRFNFADQHVIARTQKIPSVSTWVCFDSKFITSLFAMSLRLGLGRLLRKPWWRRHAVWLFMHVRAGSEICGISAYATKEIDGRSKTIEIGLIGRKESVMTAIAAAQTVHQVLSTPPGPGVYHSDQVIKLDPIVAALKDEIPVLNYFHQLGCR